MVFSVFLSQKVSPCSSGWSVPLCSQSNSVRMRVRVFILQILYSYPNSCIIGGRRASIMRLFERQQVQRLGCRSDVMPWRIFLAVDARWLFN